MNRISLAAMLLVSGCAGVSPSIGGWATQIYGPHTQLATLDTANVQESSGVVASRLNPDILWTHNDSGASGPRVWAVGLGASDVAAGVARDLGYVELTGASHVDWEDIAAGPDETIYLFDGGDNPPCSRTDKRIHRFREPRIDPAGDRVALTAAYETIRFEYPRADDPDAPANTDAQRYDAECLMVHPTTGDLYIVTKRSTQDVGVARVYKLPADRITWDSPAVHVLQFVTDLTEKLGVTANVVSTVTGGDIDGDGKRALIRRYGFAFEFSLGEGLPPDAMFDASPTVLEMAGEIQGEGICYSRDGRDIFSTSEVKFIGGVALGPSRCPVYVTPWLLANARAEPFSPVSVTIVWDTRQAMDSGVDFGTAPEYGQQQSEPGSSTAHAILLASLSASTRYYYRVNSGELHYPPLDAAEKVFFTTSLPIKPDFDGDGDVDQEDFGHLQDCLTGSNAQQDRTDCQDARLDGDDDVDGSDFDILHLCFTGPNNPANAACLSEQ